MSQRPSSQPGLHDDRRGAIMLVGLFMCCILASLAWYLLGIGQAILWRDRGQEVADTLALTSASCHARGMNLISFLNLVMLLVTMLFLLLKLIDAILIGLSVALTALAIFPPTSAAMLAGARGCFQAHRSLDKGVNQLEKLMERSFPWVGFSQKWVAIAAPWWGEFSSSAVALHYEDMGQQHYGASLSVSMLPVDWLSRLPLRRRPRTTGPTNPSGGDSGGASPHQFQLPQDLFGRYGLPVTADKYNSLCTASFQTIADFGYQGLKQLGGGWGTALNNPVTRSIIGSVVRFSTYRLKEANCRSPFWKSGQYTPPDKWSDEEAAKENVDPDCSDDAIRRQVEDIERTGGPPDPGPRPPPPGPEPPPTAPAEERARWFRAYNAYTFDWPGKKDQYDKFYSASEQRKRFKQFQDACKQAKAQTWSQADVIAAQRKNRDRGPKLMVSYAFNGNDWMQVWGFAMGAPPGDDTAREMLKVTPKLMRNAVSDSPSVERANHFYFAQAEFYLDCRDKWFTGCNNFQLATFKMAWRARLRRVKEPDFAGDMIMMLLSSVIGSDWFRDKARAAVPILNKNDTLLQNLGNLGANTLFSVLKTEVLYEANTLVSHGHIYKAGLH